MVLLLSFWGGQRLYPFCCKFKFSIIYVVDIQIIMIKRFALWPRWVS